MTDIKGGEETLYREKIEGVTWDMVYKLEVVAKVVKWSSNGRQGGRQIQVRCGNVCGKGVVAPEEVQLIVMDGQVREVQLVALNRVKKGIVHGKG